jgi:hypothetical protein
MGASGDGASGGVGIRMIRAKGVGSFLFLGLGTVVDFEFVWDG